MIIRKVVKPDKAKEGVQQEKGEEGGIQQEEGEKERG